MFHAFIKAAAEWHKKLPLKQQDFESLHWQALNSIGLVAALKSINLFTYARFSLCPR